MITTLTAIVNTDTDTGVNDYPANYKVTDKAHVHVYYVDGETPEVELVQVEVFTGGTPNEYKVNLITESGFNVELRDTYATATGRKLSIRREVPFTQEVEYPPGNDFPGSTHERALDKLTAIIQGFNEQTSRQIGVPLSEDQTNLTMPAYISNYYLGLDGDNNLIWKVGTVAVGNDEIKDSHIDWGTGSEQVSAVDMPIADAGGKITAIEVEGALQENRAAIDATEVALDVEEAALVTHKAADGKEHSDVVLNNTHRSSDGSDHTFIDQDVKAAASPSFAGGVVPAANGEIGTLVAAASTAHAVGTQYLPGTTVAGNTLIYSTAVDNTYGNGMAGLNGAAPNSVAANASYGYTGTWRLLCRVYAGTTGSYKPVGLFQRIS